MERLKLTAADVQSGGVSSCCSEGAQQQYQLYALSPCDMNAGYARLLKCTLLSLRQSHAWIRCLCALYALGDQAGKLSQVIRDITRDKHLDESWVYFYLKQQLREYLTHHVTSEKDFYHLIDKLKQIIKSLHYDICGNFGVTFIPYLYIHQLK